MSFEPQSSFGYASPASSALAAESARTFMQRVYLWMSVGLALTGGVAFVFASSNSLMHAVAPMFLPLMGVTFVIAMAFTFIAPKVNGVVAGGLFLIYATLNGVMFSVLFLVYTGGSIATAFFLTAGTFGAMSVYGTVTKKDLSAWSTFLFMGLVGIILAGIINIFLQSDLLGFVKSCAAIVIFAGLTAYDTQKLRQYHASSGYSSAASLAVTGALMLYLDFVNLFLNILRLLGRRR
jgi:FtsH-binding integral membrane protein